MQGAIRFTRLNRYGRAIGSIDTQMGFGVHNELVRRGVAEWAETPIAAAVISEPVAETTRRRSRRIDTDEKDQK